jgi:hypothetical protein
MENTDFTAASEPVAHHDSSDGLGSSQAPGNPHDTGPVDAATRDPRATGAGDKPPEKLRITYMPLPEDRDVVSVGGVAFKAYEPVELDEATSARLHALTRNPWFTTGEAPPERKEAWDKVRKARVELAKSHRAHTDLERAHNARDKRVNARPVDHVSAAVDPNRVPQGANPTPDMSAADIERTREEAEVAMIADDGTDYPVLGERVLYRPAYNPNFAEIPQDQPQAAFVAHVWPSGRVNLMVLTRDGNTFAARDVLIVGSDDVIPRSAYCTRSVRKESSGHDPAAENKTDTAI